MAPGSPGSSDGNPSAEFGYVLEAGMLSADGMVGRQLPLVY